MSETLSKFIERKTKQWVGRNFGSQEVEDPSWDIESLSDYLAKCIEKRGVESPNLQRYELTVLLPEEVDYGLAIAKVENHVEHVGGRLVSKENEGVKRLAYAINNHERADYVYLEIDLPADAPVKLSSWLNINDEVLRYLLVKKDTRRR